MPLRFLVVLSAGAAIVAELRVYVRECVCSKKRRSLLKDTGPGESKEGYRARSPSETGRTMLFQKEKAHRKKGGRARALGVYQWSPDPKVPASSSMCMYLA